VRRIGAARVAARWALTLGVLAAHALTARAVGAQSVTMETPGTRELHSVTPAFTLNAFGFGDSRPLRVVVQMSRTSDFSSNLLVDSTYFTNDTISTVQITRLLPSETNVFWKARVSAPNGRTAESPVGGPRLVPPWLILVSPNSPAGDIVDTRRPLFTWSSADAVPALGTWRYEFEITTGGSSALAATGLTDTTYTPSSDLQTNTSYRWRVRATLGSSGSIILNSKGTFIVADEPLPTRTLVYQNFPNPFPSSVAFATCFWFDVAEPGARISLDVLDLRGNKVRTIIPGADGQQDFLAGRYGQGTPGAGSNCSNRFVWDGTGYDGRTVAPGVYLLRFQAGLGTPIFRRMLFLGR
jgi:hypothetical protein